MLSPVVPTTVTATDDDRYFEAWRARELARLDHAGIAYLDYTGTPPCPLSVLRADSARLERAILGNPHSESDASRASSADLAAARAALLDFLHADPAEYGVVLTANASAACRLVGEAWPFEVGRPFVLAQDNHNSVNGVREFARARGARVAVVPLHQSMRLNDAEGVLIAHAGRPGGLYAFPAQSNFSGVRHPLEDIGFAQSLGFRVLLDAAGFVPTAALDLSLVHPDFVAVSVYKITGYPTGVGALVARHEALAELERPWFAGGTVDWVSIGAGRHRPRAGVERFEDGTPHFLAGGAVGPALAAVLAIDRCRLARHLACLTSELMAGLLALRHGNGTSLVRVHGPIDAAARGATVAITLRDSRGAVVPYWRVESHAREAGLAMRGGCFCNPGCAEAAFGWSGALTEPCLDALGDDFTVPRFSDCLGSGPVGAIRMSLGMGSVRRDVARALEFFGSYLDR